MVLQSPLQNRVSPFGEIVATAERGALFGNRGGCLHDAETGRIVGRPWTNSRWITCLLEYKGWRREVMQPNRYTELFFLDEATAFAAGHRPCFLCRRADATQFAEAWARANLGPGATVQGNISQLDTQLHAERVDPKTRRQRTHRAELASLPSGAFVALDSTPTQPMLVWQGALYRWSFAGYEGEARTGAEGEVTVLTPRSTVAAFGAGYTPTAALA